MIDITDKREKAMSLKKQGKYEEAILLFKELFEETNDKWDGWNLAYCYNKCKNYSDALEVSKKVYALDNEFDYIKSQFAWSAYMLNIKDFANDDNYETLKSYGNGILKLTETNHEDVFRQLTVLKLMEFCEKKGLWEAVVVWSEKINANVLNAEPFQMNKNGKNITIPSSREKYYLKITKAFEKLEKWEKCFEISCDALNHFPDEIWFKRRKAISVGNLGDIEKAIEDLIKISLVKTDWFIFRDIAVLYAKNDNYDTALDFIIDGCIVSINQPDPGYRWELYYDAALFLQKKGDNKLAEKHLLLSYSLRNNEGWKIPEVISKLASEMDISLESIEDTKNVFRELKPFWDKHKFSKLPKHIGKIKTMLPNGKSGFITSEDGEDFYFKIFSFNGNKKRIIAGLKVEFFVQESFDRSKNEKSYQAVNITPIDGV
ncbi:MAG: cold shock domain-containing protein [Candidatus Marinimicrobia bacterium]|jgi:tetratricopeptide (TPR) repeat protein|nr:cold shock domain-containing protein [Candidatus Neomarinimicrobiota bacterium]MBT6938639.1 cold shock domain-containing protein [Candidatus Neomarinimicrobiota bacterium]